MHKNRSLANKYWPKEAEASNILIALKYQIIPAIKMRHLPGNRDVLGGQYLTFVSPKKEKKKKLSDNTITIIHIYIYIYIYQSPVAWTPHISVIYPLLLSEPSLPIIVVSHICVFNQSLAA